MLRPMKTALLLLLALAAASAAWAQQGPASAAPAPREVKLSPTVEVRVLPRAEVPGDEFALGEVAELDGPDMDLVRRIAGVSMGRSPAPGRSLRLTEAFIRSRLLAVVAVDQVHLVVPSDAEVVRASQVISGDDIAAKVLAQAAQQIGGAQGDLEQTLVGTIQDAVLPTGEVTWEIEPMGKYLTAGGMRTYRVVAKVNGNEAWRGVARINQQIYRNVVVAAHTLRRNQLLRPEDLTTERRPVVGLKDDSYVTHLIDVVGGRTKRPVARGEWINRDMLAAVPDVSEGGPVLLVYQTDEVRFTSPGVALVPAQVGQFIPVRNLESGKIVYGVVQSDETVKVN
jgi:flagella basal body P-ring formation protein FlgA